MLSFDQLAALDLTLWLGSGASAAEVLDVNQSTVSRQQAAVLRLLCLRLIRRPDGPRLKGDLELLRAERDDEGVRLDFRLRVSLPAPVRQALERGVPLYFTATALLKEERWWWRDRRLVRVERSWRLAYLPLASTWRVGLSGLTQAADTLYEALALFSRVAGWRVADRDLLAQMTPEARHHIEFNFGLDTSRLPGLMQIGLAEQADWNVSARRRVSLPRS